MRTGCILLAAGASSRFGEKNKLLAPFRGRPLYEWAFAAIPEASCFGCGVCVVAAEAELLGAAEARGYLAYPNREQEKGQSRSLQLGMEALLPREPDALLFMVADQPLLRRESVEALLEAAKAHPGCILRLGAAGRTGNPALFPRQFFPALLALRGDCGGGAVIRAHPEALRIVEIPDARELMDADSPAALAELEREARSKTFCN